MTNDSNAVVHPARIHTLRHGDLANGPIVLWLQRDLRIHDNWAFIHAAELANQRGVPVHAVFCFAPEMSDWNLRQIRFMFEGLLETAESAGELGVPFEFLFGAPEAMLPSYMAKVHGAALVTDFSPLREPLRWKQKVAERLQCPMVEVDAHNVVPCRMASDKQEYAARTIRPKIHRMLDSFFVEYPKMPNFPAAPLLPLPTLDSLLARVEAVQYGPDLPISGGTSAGQAQLDGFLSTRFHRYAEQRNDPNAEATSGISPWLHFGHIAPQRAILNSSRHAGNNPESHDSFLEELVIRRELSDNYCLYCPTYDSVAGLPQWAIKTLEAHAGDVRHVGHTPDQFEAADTLDPLWNAAQTQLVRTGVMHGYMRMYWAKKILEWSDTYDHALQTALLLNDRYAVDGRDPNGFVGVLWSIGGLHDRPWKEREIFGMVRYMNARGCARKFDVQQYISSWSA